MADFTQIIQKINDDINTNGVGAITGAKLNEVLCDMIAAVNDEKQDPLTIDATPTEGSTNPVQSGGVYDALEDKADKVSGATNGNIASFDANGNIQDSGIAASDVATDSDLAGKQDVISDLVNIRSGAAAGATAYQKPGTGIPSTDMASAVQTSLEKADTAYQKPSGGVPKSDLASSVQTSLGKADTAIQPAEFNELEEEVGTIGNGAYEEAWDGSSAPVVADIPAGVSVTYNSTSYTGTLAASASTVDKIYLVSDGNGNYDRYVTIENSGTYSWKKVGTTAIPLSDYATNTQVNQLEAKVTPIEAATDLLEWEFTYTFDKTKPSSALLNNPIVLSQEGDSLEVYVTDVPSTQNMNAGGYAFAGKNGSTRGNIALSYTGSVWVRADNDSWILQYGNGATGSTRRVKIVYNSASIDFYVDGTKVSTYNSLTPITIYTFGNANNSSNYGYWSGKIKELKVNGVDVYLSSIATLTNVVVEGNHSFLSPSDLEDSLESTSTSKALTANQGNVLKGLIDDAEEDITALEGSVTGIEETAFGEVDETTTTNIDEVPGVVKMAGYNAGPNGGTEVLFSALSVYDSYYFYPSSALSAWLTDPGVSYIAISIVENAQPFSINAIQGTSAYRKRKSDGNLPSESSPLSIPEGSAVIVTVSAGTVVGFSNKIKKTTFNGETPLAQEHIEQVINAIEDEEGGLEMYVSKTATQLDVYLRIQNGKYIHYPFWKRYKAYTADEYPSFYDNWGIGQLAIAAFSGTMADEANIFEPGEAELAMSVPSGKDAENNVYVGGQAHGFENIVTGDNGREICILVDNQKVAEDAVLSLVPVTKVDIIQHTQICQAYTNTNPFADVTKHWVWENGKMSCTTSVKVLRSIFFRYAQFGMMCVYRRWLGDVNNDYLTNAAIKNDAPYKVWDVSDGWSGMLQSPDKNCTRIVEYGQKGLGFSMSVKSETVEDNGGMFVATNGLAYNKIYFDMGRSFTPEVDDVLEATQTWEIL